MGALDFRYATTDDIRVIHELAHEVWWPTYEQYIPHGQIELMLDLIYTEAALHEQMAADQRFLLAERDKQLAGFVAFRPKPATKTVMRIEKFYVRQTEQGKGTGRQLIQRAAEAASHAGFGYLELNVNRNNPARAFYERVGFAIAETVDIPYHGYVLNDYIMQKPLD